MANDCGELIPDAIPDHPAERQEAKSVAAKVPLLSMATSLTDRSASSKFCHHRLTTPITRQMIVLLADTFPSFTLITVPQAAPAGAFPFILLKSKNSIPCPANGDATELASKISTSYFDACMLWRNLEDMGRIATCTHLVVTPMGWNDTVQDSLKALEVFSGEYDALPDLMKADNLMMRKKTAHWFSPTLFLWNDRP